VKPLAQRRFDVLCAGEALVDFLPERRGQRLGDVECWQRSSGGSPANVAIGLARLGARAAFTGVVGDDEFGRFLREALASEGVDVAALRRAPARTGIVFISLDARGERSFTDYRKPSAELLWEPADLAGIDFEELRAVHLSINSLVTPQAAQAARELIARARRAGCLVSCDPNLRLNFWPDPEPLRALTAELLPQVDLLKLAEDEVEFCTGVRDPREASQAMAQQGVGLCVVTRGERGAIGWRGGKVFEVAAPQVEVVDLTGAGDGFDAGLLARLSAGMRAGRRVAEMSDEEIRAALEFGCQVGAAVVTRLGAVAGLPRRSAFD
jgi:fructokinase